MMVYWRSATCSKCSWSCDVPRSGSELANSGSLINDLVSGKIKGKGARACNLWAYYERNIHDKIEITCQT